MARQDGLVPRGGRVGLTLAIAAIAIVLAMAVLASVNPSRKAEDASLPEVTAHLAKTCPLLAPA